MPATVPIDDSRVQSELTRYLPDNWVPVIEKDVDGPHSLPLAIDRDNPNLGRYSATRRVARTIYLGSAPDREDGAPGLEDRAASGSAVSSPARAPPYSAMRSVGWPTGPRICTRIATGTGSRPSRP